MENSAQFIFDHFGMTETEFEQEFVVKSLKEVSDELSEKNTRFTATAQKTLPSVNAIYRKPFQIYTDITFGSDFTEDMPKPPSWGKATIITDNRNKPTEDLTDKEVRTSPYNEPLQRTYTRVDDEEINKKYKGKRLMVDYVEMYENGVQTIHIRSRRELHPINYIGTINFEGVKSVTLVDGSEKKWLKAQNNLLFSDDFLHINGMAIGSWVQESDSIFAGVYTIRLSGDTKTKVARHGNIFDNIMLDLRRSTNTNFLNGTKKCGIAGAEIYVSEHIASEDERKERKREMVEEMRRNGEALYNNEPVKDTEEATVDMFACVGGFQYRTPEEKQWNNMDTTNLVFGMYSAYANHGGKENGMFFKIY